MWDMLCSGPGEWSPSDGNLERLKDSVKEPEGLSFAFDDEPWPGAFSQTLSVVASSRAMAGKVAPRLPITIASMFLADARS